MEFKVKSVLGKMNVHPERIILGIDPGTSVLGYGVIRVLGKNKSELIVLGVVDLKKYPDHYLKLKAIYERVQQLVIEYLPDEVAIEAPFFGKNVQSMLKLGRAQGVAMAAVLSRSVPIFEYAPRKIKMAITGQGNASKEQVAAMLKSILKVNDFDQKYFDATDGLAAAVCHSYQLHGTGGGAKVSSWEKFIKTNPTRVKK
ncbi:MAG TPA: crossover junction endodeoxyribonuclease RuvC [Tenuifilaceae bacterium]|nr:crossover junction endodeoxyribonuclease RuvC [Tenuifilaceae bacterium]HPE18629.1 crossover junction endodeoxyribonuclease RuvC [Tenuifilaceae bacterium]HPJ46089.1 crossover junction endodeoxyribonuclease RuvC [Tenuifilaceae bacterium]HPQ34433.1 crossover junction endodeoxyribonuclease RuvC [Tenuifilaceae bacterium]